MMPGTAAGALPAGQPRFGEALALQVKIGLLSFGGPAGQIALMQDEIVARRGWVAPEAFDRGLAFAMMLPGPEAQQLACWLGWRLHGLWGGVAAGLAFVAPGALLMLLLAWIAAAFGEQRLVAAVFEGIQPVVIAVVLAAMVKLARRALKGPVPVGIALASFVGIALLGLPFPLIVLAAAIAGVALLPRPAAAAMGALPPWRGQALAVSGATAALILGVFALTWAAAGAQPWRDIAELFLSAAIVTFGGAYAVLPYVADRAVETYGWLTASQMLNGLAIAEATPGPLILVNTYAGFFAGWSQVGGAGAGVLGGLLATFYTFAPSTMLILAFAPIVERVQAVPLAAAALAGVSAAVVGVIASLGVYLAQAAFLPQGLGDPAWAKLALFAVALWLVFGRGVGILPLIAFGAAAGLGLDLGGLL